MTDAASMLGAGRCILLTALVLAGCSSDERAPARSVLSVFAASSLTEAFAELGQGFEASHPKVDVATTFAGSQILRLQIEQGARADVFAAADERHMQALVEQGLVSRPAVAAYNELVVIVPADNPAGIESLGDLGRASRLVIGTENAPIGEYTRQMLGRARGQLGEGFSTEVLRRVVSEESNARLVRAKVALGEADAAVVYRTDASSSSNVRVIPIPDDVNVRASYPVGVLSRTPSSTEARAYVDYVLSREGREVLGRHGFVLGEEGD